MTENIVQGPWANGMKQTRSARALQVDRIEREFKATGRRDEDVFQCLAAKMHGYLAEVEANGRKSGGIGRIIGGDTDGTARHRSRFSWDGKPQDFHKYPLAKNPGQWLGVLRRCAKELQRQPDELLLDAFSGSRIRLSVFPTDFVRESWMQSFLDLMIILEDRLCSQSDVAGLLEYVAAALLEFGADGLIEADDAILPSFRADIPDWPAILDQLPFTQTCLCPIGGYSYPPGLPLDVRQAEAWSKLFEGCQVSHLVESHHLSLVMMVQRGLAIIPAEGTARPRLALFKCPIAKLVVSDLGVKIDKNSIFINIPSEIDEFAGEILFPIYPDYAPHLVNRVSFAALGSEAFNAAASESLAGYDWFEVHQKTDGGGCWDPMYAEEGTSIEWASSAPKATVAAIIERNLLFADEAGVSDQRIDRLLRAEIDRMIAAVRKYRERVDQIVAPARLNLLSEWARYSVHHEIKA